MSTDSSDRLDAASLTGLQQIGIGLAAITGLLHLWLFVAFLGSPLGWGFLIAALGFFGGIAAVVLDYRRRLVYTLGIPFTGGQIVLWYYINFVAGSYAFPADVGWQGALDKVVQIALIAVLALALSRERQ